MGATQDSLDLLTQRLMLMFRMFLTTPT